MNAIQKLDLVLSWIYENKNAEGFTQAHFINHNLNRIHANVANWDADIGAILLKLKDDGYVVHRRVDTPSNETWHTINILREERIYLTFDGAFFVEMGGYTKKKYLDEKKERIASRNETLLVFGSIGAALGAFGLIYFEFLKLNVKQICVVSHALLLVVLIIGIIAGAILWMIFSERYKQDKL